MRILARVGEIAIFAAYFAIFRKGFNSVALGDYTMIFLCGAAGQQILGIIERYFNREVE